MTLFDGPGWWRMMARSAQDRLHTSASAQQRARLKAWCGFCAMLIWCSMLVSGDIKIKGWAGWVITAAVIGLSCWLVWTANAPR